MYLDNQAIEYNSVSLQFFSLIFLYILSYLYYFEKLFMCDTSIHYKFFS